MSLSEVPEIPRAFAEWGTEQVIQWLTKLQLSRDYAKQFRDHNIDGPGLLRLNPSSLSSLGITDRLDRVKLLQQITTMQADLASLASPARRWRGVGKLRRYSESPAYCTLAGPPRKRSADNDKPQGMAQHAQSRPSFVNPQQWNRSRTQSLQTFPGTPSTSGTLYSVAGSSNSSMIGMSHSEIGASISESPNDHSVMRLASSDVGPARSHSADGREDTPLRRKNSPRKKKKISRSMDKLWEAHLVSNPLPLVKNYQIQTPNGTAHYHSAGAQFQGGPAHRDTIAVQLHDGISRHNTGSIQLHNGVSHQDIGAEQLHDSVQLVEILQGENAALKQELEIYYQRVCKLMRLEQELEKVREAHKHLEESSQRRQMLEAAMRTRLEDELTRLRNNSRRRHSSEHLHRHATDSSMVPQVYSQSIERLKEHLHSLQQISQRREELEKRVRVQLQAEIRELRGRDDHTARREGEGHTERDEGPEEGEGGGVQEKGEERRQEFGVVNWETEVAVLQADLAKWEQKCAEMAAEKELAVEVALIDKEAHISHLKEVLAARDEEVTELTMQNKSCQCQLAEAHSRIAELEASVSILQSADTAIHSMQHSSSGSLHVHSSPPHQVQTSPSHQTRRSPSHQAWRSPSHQVHPSHSQQVYSSPPTHQIHSSPPHQVHSSPPHKVHPSPPHQVHSSPPHKVHSSPTHQVHSSPPHKVHSSPTHQIHSPPVHAVQLSPKINKKPVSNELSLGSSTSLSSSPVSEPQSNSDVHRHRDQQYNPYLTNGGEDPAVTTSSSPQMSPNEDNTLQPSISLPSRLHHTSERIAPVINTSLSISGQGSTLHATPPHQTSITHSTNGLNSPRDQTAGNRSQLKSSVLADVPTLNQSDTNCSSSPRHRLVKSKTPPPQNEVRLSPMKYKYKSVDSSPSDLQLFNTLIGDRAPGDSRGVKLNGTYGGKGVNTTGALFTYPHGNHTRV